MPSKTPKGKTPTGPGMGVATPVSKRQHKARTPNAALLSGSLGDELQSHAFERCRHFFLFLTTIKALEFVSRKLNQHSTVTALSGFEVKATDQIDDGFRVEGTDYEDFDDDDENVIYRACTSFKRTDAAHFCNLGIKSGFAGVLDLTNPVVFDLYELLKVCAGNTRWLPQRVNIGPDRKIDVLHGELAKEMLGDGKVVFSRARIKEYVDRATQALVGYSVMCTKAKKRGVAKCALCYTLAYADADFIDRVYASIQGGLSGWAYATNNRDALDVLLD